MQNYKLRDHLLTQSVADETVILDTESGAYFTLDAVGTRMIQLLREEGDANAVVRRMTEEFEADAETIEHDLTDLLKNMADHGLVDELGAEGPGAA